MSQENVEAVRGVYDRWSNGEFQASLDLFDPLALLVLPAGIPEAGTYLGVEEIVDTRENSSSRGPHHYRS